MDVDLQTTLRQVGAAVRLGEGVERLGKVDAVARVQRDRDALHEAEDLHLQQ